MQVDGPEDGNGERNDVEQREPDGNHEQDPDRSPLAEQPGHDHDRQKDPRQPDIQLRLPATLGDYPNAFDVDAVGEKDELRADDLESRDRGECDDAWQLVTPGSTEVSKPGQAARPTG